MNFDNSDYPFKLIPGFAQIFGCKIKDFFQTFSKMMISFSEPKFSIYSLSHDALWTYSNHDAVLI